MTCDRSIAWTVARSVLSLAWTVVARSALRVVSIVARSILSVAWTVTRRSDVARSGQSVTVTWSVVCIVARSDLARDWSE